MKHGNDPLKQELKPLLEKVAVEEAGQKVWELFQKGMDGLSEHSATLLSEYFDGNTVESLADKYQATPEEVRALLDYAKQELINRLKAETRIRQ